MVGTYASVFTITYSDDATREYRPACGAGVGLSYRGTGTSPVVAVMPRACCAS